MVVVAVDPNKKDLKLLVKHLRTAFPGCEVVMFTNPEAAAAYIRDNPIDALYTEAAMLKTTGFGLQEAVQEVQPAVLTVFVTETDDYAGKALKSRAQGYIIKPVSTNSIRESMLGTSFEYSEH